MFCNIPAKLLQKSLRFWGQFRTKIQKEILDLSSHSLFWSITSAAARWFSSCRKVFWSCCCFKCWRNLYNQPLSYTLNLFLKTYRVFIKNLAFFPIASNPLHVGELLIWSEIWMYIVTIIGWPFSVQPIAAAQGWRGRGRKILKTLGKKTQYLINTLYLTSWVPYLQH